MYWQHVKVQATAQPPVTAHQAKPLVKAFASKYGDSSSGGRNVLYRCSGSAVLNSAEAQSILGSGARVSFANEGSVIKANLTTRQAANRVGHSDEQTCVRAFLNAAKKFQETAAKNGGHRVTHLHSYLNKNALSGGQYECEVGTFHGRVLMRANIAR